MSELLASDTDNCHSYYLAPLSFIVGLFIPGQAMYQAISALLLASLHSSI